MRKWQQIERGVREILSEIGMLYIHHTGTLLILSTIQFSPSPSFLLGSGTWKNSDLFPFT